MNKKLIIAICGGAVALVVIVCLIVGLTTNLFKFIPNVLEDSSSGSGSSNTSGGDSSDDSSVGGADIGQVVIEKGGITIASVSGKPGDTVTVPVKINENPGFMAFLFSVKYDSSVLEYDSCKDGDLLGDLMLNPQDGIVGVNAISDSDIEGDGTLFNLVFKIKDGAKAGKYDITLNVGKDNMANYNEEAIVPTVTNGSVTVK